MKHTSAWHGIIISYLDVTLPSKGLLESHSLTTQELPQTTWITCVIYMVKGDYACIGILSTHQQMWQGIDYVAVQIWNHSQGHITENYWEFKDILLRIKSASGIYIKYLRQICLHNTTLQLGNDFSKFHSSSTRAQFQYKDHLSRYSVFH